MATESGKESVLTAEGKLGKLSSLFIEPMATQNHEKSRCQSYSVVIIKVRMLLLICPIDETGETGNISTLKWFGPGGLAPQVQQLLKTHDLRGADSMILPQWIFR